MKKLIFHIMTPGHEQLKMLLATLLVASTCHLYLSFVSLQTTLCFGLIVASLLGLAFIKWLKLREVGVLNRLPARFATLLLERSLFDVLCDIWYFQVLKRTVKTFLLPFIFKDDPQQVIKSFDELPTPLREVVLRKGIINLLPKFVQQELTHNYVAEIDQEERKEEHKEERKEEHKEDHKEDEQFQVAVIPRTIDLAPQLKVQTPRQIALRKVQQLENVKQCVFVKTWDQTEAYREFLVRRHPPQKQALLKLVSTVVFNRKFDTRMIHRTQDLLLNAHKLKVKAGRMVLISFGLMVVHYYLVKGSRNIYKNTVMTLVCLALMGSCAASMGLLLTTKKKQKQIESEGVT